jgi:hypothetical protein
MIDGLADPDDAEFDIQRALPPTAGGAIRRPRRVEHVGDG